MSTAAFAATIRGDNRNNVLQGTDRPDTIYGRGGHDRIYGYKENDIDGIYYYSISTLVHGDFCIFYFFLHCGIRTRVISGFSGMQLKIQLNLKGAKKIASSLI